MKLIKLIILMLIGVFLICHDTIYAQVTYALGNTAYYTKYTSGGDIFQNNEELGMWANTGDEQVVAWRNLQTAGDNSGTIRSLQVGDVFTISVEAAHAYGQMGFSLNANASAGSWANRYSNSRLYIQADGTGSWYVNHNGGGTTLNYNVSATIRTYEFKVFITSLSTCNVEFYVNGGFHSRLMNLTLTGTAGANIDGFSLYLQNDNGNIYWKQTTQHQALGNVDLGYYLTSGTFTPGLVQNGLESNSTSISNTNNINIGGDAGTYVILNQTNTYSGSTTVNTNARLELQNIAALGSTNGVTVTSGGALSLYFASGTNTFSTYATTLNGAGVSGANGALRSTGGNNNWPGGITLASSSRVNADASGAAGSLTLSGVVTLASNTLTIGGSASSVTISGKISGTGVLAKDGTNTLSLSNATNDYSGGTVLTAGTISLANNAVLGTGDLTFGSGATTCTIDVTDNTSRSGTIKVVEASTAGVINVADGKTFTLNGAITSTGTNAATKFGKSGSGTLIVSADGSSYPGQIQVGNGTVIVQNDGGLGTNTSTANRGIDLGLNVGDVSQANNVSVLATDGIIVPQSIYIAPNTSSATRTLGLSGTGITTFNNEIYLDGTLTASGGSGTVTLSGNLINTGGLISSGGIVILSGTSNTFSGTTTVTAGTLELQGSIANSEVTVQSGATLKIIGDNVIVASLTVESGGNVEVVAGKSLTVSGNLDNNQAAGIVLKSSESSGPSSSLIVEGTVSGSGTINAERYIAAANWASSQDGFHLLSSPVAAEAISGAWTPSGAGNDYDFYGWSESHQKWVNKKNVDPLDPPTWTDFHPEANFNVGQGYLVAYETAETKIFSGALNTGNQSVTLKLSGTPAVNNSYGYNLIGNPFTSALDWAHASWGTENSNYGGVAKIWSGGAFIDVVTADPVDTDVTIIPAMNGFFVYTTVDGNDFTIPAAAQLHSSDNWHKSVNNNTKVVKLKVNGINSNLTQVSSIRFNSEATTGFDLAYDSYFMPGYAPVFYSVSEGKNYSTNALPSYDAETVIPFVFVKNENSEFILELTNGIEGEPIYLSDNKTGTIHKLSENPVYTFTSEEGDTPDRFLLHFGVVGLGEQDAASQLQAYVYGDQLYVMGAEGQAQVSVYDIQGRLVQEAQANISGLYSQSLQLPAGVYVVRLHSETASSATKIVIK